MKNLKFVLLLIPALLQYSFIQKDTDNFAYRKVDNKAFTYGEKLKYRVHYGFINAASIDITIDEKPSIIDQRSTYHIVAKGNTYSSFDWMYKVRDHYESYVDVESMAPLKYFKSIKENKYTDKDLVFYDHKAQYLKGYKKDMTAPAYVQDLVSSLFYARTLDFSNAVEGKTFPVDVYLDQEIYNLKFKYLGKETIKSDLGKVRCIKMRPQLVVDKVFKDEDAMTIWVTDDANHIPVRVQAEIYIGALKIDLVSYDGLANNFSSKVN